MRFLRKSSRSTTAALLLGLTAALSCRGTPDGTISLTTGEETDVFSRAPAPALLVTEKVAVDGTKTEISRAVIPIDSIDLGERERSEIAALSIRGLDGAGNTVVRGESLYIQWGALENGGLEIFVQRTGDVARMPRGPSPLDPTATTMVLGRYIVEAAGTSTLLYDLLGLRTLSNPPLLPRPARSLVPLGSAVLVIDEAGATMFDLSSGQSAPLDAPAGGTYAEISGGARVGAPDGTQYVVGATRAAGAGGPTARVLVVDPEGKTSFAALTVPREGACASFVEGRGVVIAGGDAVGAGAELLAPGAAVATPLPFPPDAVKGCGAATLDTSHVLLAGGTDAAGASPATRALDLACTTGCAPIAWPDALPMPLVRAQAIGLAADAALIAGDDAAGATHLFRASSAGGQREIAFKTPRRGARMVATPTAIAFIGGGAGVEQYLE